MNPVCHAIRRNTRNSLMTMATRAGLRILRILSAGVPALPGKRGGLSRAGRSKSRAVEPYGFSSRPGTKNRHGGGFWRPVRDCVRFAHALRWCEFLLRNSIERYTYSCRWRSFVGQSNPAGSRPFGAQKNRHDGGFWRPVRDSNPCYRRERAVS